MAFSHQHRSRILPQNVDCLLSLGLQQPVSSSLIDGHEVRLVVFEIRSRVGVLDGEAKGARELGKRSHVGGIVQKLCDFPLKVVVARHQIEDAFLTLPYWS